MPLAAPSIRSSEWRSTRPPVRTPRRVGLVRPRERGTCRAAAPRPPPRHQPVAVEDAWMVLIAGRKRKPRNLATVMTVAKDLTPQISLRNSSTTAWRGWGLSSAPNNERTRPGRRGDRVSFQDACNRFTSRQGSRTVSIAAKKSPSIASRPTLPRIIPLPPAVTCR